MHKKPCLKPGCAKAAFTRGLCYKHYDQWRFFEREVAPCSVEGCLDPVTAKGLCYPHYRRLRKYGSPTLGAPVRASKVKTREFVEQAIGHLGEGDCLQWPFRVAPTGYAIIRIAGRPHFVHRYVCEQVHGEPPSEIHQAAHSCGNRRCVNPHHLRWATPRENHADKIIHGTRQNGERNGFAKLTEKQVAEIRHIARTTDMSHKAIGALFGICQPHISRIVRGASWADTSSEVAV